MTIPSDISDEMKLTMARAFDRAWQRFSRALSPTNADELRTALAQHLVAMVRHGETDEGRLSAGGMIHLRSLHHRDKPPIAEVSNRAAKRARRYRDNSDNNNEGFQP
jgi:hypothetical protein